MIRALGALLLVLAACGLSSRPDGGTGGGSEATGGGSSAMGGGSGGTGGGSSGTGGGVGGSGGSATGGGTATPAWHFDPVATGITTTKLRAVHGSSPTDYWVLADDGTVYHSNGTSFTAVSNATGAVALTTLDGDVFLAGPTALRACTGGCRSAGSFFDSFAPGDPMLGACSHPVHGVFASGGPPDTNAVIFHFTQGLWHRVWLGSNVRDLTGCFITDDGRVWATGREGVMSARADGGSGSGSESVSPSASGEFWYAGTGTDAGRIVGGNAWRIAAREGTSGLYWPKVLNPAGATGVVRTLVRLGNGNDVVAGGTYEDGRGFTIRRDGTWRPQTTPIDVWGAWGVSRDEFFLAGSVPDGGTGLLLHATFY